MFLCFSSLASNAIEAVGESSGYYYNSVWEKWYEYPIVVHVIPYGSTLITGGRGMITATGILRPPNKILRVEKDERVIFIASLKKYLEWQKIAKKRNLEVEKELGYINDFLLTFRSSNGGRKSHLDMQIFSAYGKDSISLRLNSTQVITLIHVLERVPSVLERIRKQEKKADKLLK